MLLRFRTVGEQLFCVVDEQHDGACFGSVVVKIVSCSSVTSRHVAVFPAHSLTHSIFVVSHKSFDVLQVRCCVGVLSADICFVVLRLDPFDLE